ncbi:MAG: class I SAM-dependent rRNA methyltransferase, partial [Chloroflexi bacterium]|nr:class I SAM-dependent rRNA methyltransferase [Chloroflexota bacterium]
RYMAVGLYDPQSPIRVRVLQHGKSAEIGLDWFRERLKTAVSIRQPLHKTDTNAYRLVHGANDGFEGVVIDRYDKTVVVKLYSAAWVVHLQPLLTALTQIIDIEHIVLRLSRGVAKQTDALYGLQNGDLLLGDRADGLVTYRENGLTFVADVVNGQKTGAFLDQRDNRARVEAFSEGASVLNVFSYTGGFSLYAARGGATDVVSLDLSKPALAMARDNFELNRSHPAIARANHTLLAGDAFQEMANLRQQKRQFDVVIIDPPSFAQNQSQISRALSAYKRLVRLGLGVLAPGGTLVMASCSSRITADDFFEVVHEAAREGKRPLIEIERTSHALDHPIGFKEGAYLKCLFVTAP